MKNRIFLFCVYLFAMLLQFFCSPVLSATSEIQQLALEAKQRFSVAMHPPFSENPLIMHVIDEPTAPFRDYLVNSFNEAIDALVLEANNPERQTVVTGALRDLVKSGETESVDRVFAVMLERALAKNKAPNPDAAAILRHSVALVELPIALQPTALAARHPQKVSPFVSISLDGTYSFSSKSGIKAMPGPKALQAYLKAVSLDPSDFWTWIVIATLIQPPQSFESVLAGPEKIANTNNDKHQLVFVKMELGRLEAKSILEGVSSHTEKVIQAYGDAANIALGALTENPADDAWKHDLASALLSLGNILIKSQPADSKEHTEALVLLEKALQLRSQLATSHPDNPNLTLELAVAHSSLADAHYLPGKPRDIENQKHNAEADRLFNSLIASDRLKPTVKPQSGMIIFGLMLAGVLTLFIGLVLIFMYRRRIARWMHEASSACIESDNRASQISAQIADQTRTIEFAWLTAQTYSHCTSFASVQMASACRHLRWASWVYLSGGIVFALIAAWLFLTLGKVEVNLIRMIGTSLIYVWPVILTLWLLWGPDRKKFIMLFSLYFGILLALGLQQTALGAPAVSIVGMSVPAFFQPIVLWFSQAISSLYLLLFLNHYIRALGPVMMVLLITLIVGSLLLMVLTSSPVGMDLWASFSVWLGNQTGTSINPSMWSIWLLGALLIAPIGWRLIVELCRRYETKNYSEMILIIDTIWFFEMCNLCIDLSNNAGQGFWLGISSFAAYKIITYFGMWPLFRKASQIAPSRLLLLRVFGYARRSERLLKLLEARWRYAGPIQLIAAPDLASSTVDPGDFINFITGKLRSLFVIERVDIERNLAKMDYLPDPDGRYRINEVFCGNDAWRPVVQRLMADNDIVVMDLRSFSVKNQGCLFELQALVDYVPFERIVLLADNSTDTDLLAQTLSERWQRVITDSPNAQGNGIIHILNIARWDETAIDTLLSFADRLLSTAGDVSLSKQYRLAVAS